MSVAKKVVGQPRFVAKRVTEEVVTPPDPGGGIGVATPQLRPTNEPPDAFASWQTGPFSIVEGRTASVVVQTSRPVPTNSVIPIVLDSSSSIDPDAVTFPSEALFLTGDTEKRFDVVFRNDAAAGLFEGCILKLDPNAATGSSAPVLPTNTAFGPDTLTITVTDDVITGGPPEWTLATVSSIQEGAGEQAWQLSLDKETTDGSDVVIDVAVTGGTAQEIEDYVFAPQRVTIPGGQTQGSYAIRFPNNDTQVFGPDPTLEITATYISGNVANTGPQSFTTTILDNDDGTSTRPILQFTAAAQEVLAGRVYTVTVFSVNENNEPQNPGTLAPYPVEVTELNGIANSYVVDWAGDPGTVTMQPNQNRVSFTVTLSNSIPIGDPPPTLRFRLKSPVEVGLPSNQWTVGVQNTTELIVLEEEPTDLFFPEFNGVGAVTSRVIQGIYAVNPPRAELPQMTITSNGSYAQCFGHKRNANGDWIAGYFYALRYNGDESVPDSSVQVEALRLSLTDSDTIYSPAVIGDTEELTFSLSAANVTESFVGVVNTMGATERGNWSSQDDGAVHTSIGDVSYIEENVTRTEMVRSDVTTPGDGDYYLASEALGYVELCETRYLGDGVRVFYGRFVNGRWNENVDATVANPQVNGEIYIQDLRVDIGSTSTYSITLGNAHPNQSLDVDLGGAELLVDRGSDYFMPTCASYPFSFAIYPTGDTAALDRANDYLDMRHIAWSIGAYGPTRNPIYGEGNELTIDYKRMGLTLQGRQGWGAVKYIGDIQGDGGGPNSREGYKAAWANGNAISGAEHGRMGWFQSTGPAGDSADGSSGIYGAYGLVPWWGYWLRQKYDLYANVSRNNIAYRDTVSWEPAWWYNISYPNGTPTFDRTVPFLGNPIGKRGTLRHFHFNNSVNTDASDLWDVSNYTDYQLAPESEAYNSPENAPPNVSVGGNSQSEVDWIRNDYRMYAATHLTRAQGGAIDMWDACRVHMAYAFREEVSAFLSRIFAPTIYVDGPTQDEQAEFNTAYRLERLLSFAPPTFGVSSRRGTWPRGVIGVDQNPFMGSRGDSREFSIPMIWLGGFYAIASDVDRNRLYGTGSVGGGDNVLPDMWWALRYQTTPQGIPCFDAGGAFNPDPSDENIFGATDMATRQNAWPDGEVDTLGNYGDVTDEVYAVGLPFYQMPFWSRAVRIFKESVIDRVNSADDLDRALQWHDYIITAHRQFSSAGGNLNLPYCAVVAIGTKFTGFVDEADQFTTWTLDDVIGGTFRWLWPNIPTSGDDGGDRLRKTGWSSYDATVGLGDDTYLSLFQDSWGSVQSLTEAEFAQLLATEVNGIFGASNNTSYKLFGEWTFYSAYLAYLLNRVS